LNKNEINEIKAEIRSIKRWMESLENQLVDLFSVMDDVLKKIRELVDIE